VYFVGFSLHNYIEMNGQQNIKYKASFVKYRLQTSNSNNHFMDPSSSLISDGKRYTGFICKVVFFLEWDDVSEVRHDIICCFAYI
jgi:hypothetical protein